MKQLPSGEEKKIKKTRYKPRTKLEQDVREIKTWVIILFLMMLGNICFMVIYPLYNSLATVSAFFVKLGDIFIN